MGGGKEKVGNRVCPLLPFCGKSEMAKKKKKKRERERERENQNILIILLSKDFLCH